MIIAVDFDGTLRFNDGTANLALIQKLKAAQMQGNTCILWTCREGKSLQDALLFLKENGFAPNLVNENHPEIIRRLKYNPRKVLADIYIDDKGAK